MDRSRLKNYLGFVFRFTLSVAALYYVFTKIHVADVINTYRHVNIPWLALAILLFTLSKIISAFRLNLFLRSVPLMLSHRFNLKLYLLGMFYNVFLPGGVGGDGYKIVFLSREFNVKKRRIFWPVLLDRVSGVISLLVWAVIFSYFIRLHITFPYKYVIWFIIPAGVFIYYAIIRKFFPAFIAIFPSAILYSLAVQITQVFCACILLVSLGTTDMAVNYLFLFLISSLVAMLPISIGGMGLREITFLSGASLLHLDAEASVALSLLFYLISVFVSLFGISYSLNPAKMKDRHTIFPRHA